MTEKELVDVWHKCNECKFHYTWARKQQKNRTLARLDFLLASTNMLSKIMTISIISASQLSDYLPPICMIVSNSMSPDFGFSRFDNKILNDPLFLSIILELISRGAGKSEDL